ncbi:MAG: hypothetical protein LBK22_04720, partial [Tannerella sp.]|nr:hypothetical protein [Tannerella sp.]
MIQRFKGEQGAIQIVAPPIRTLDLHFVKKIKGSNFVMIKRDKNNKFKKKGNKAAKNSFREPGTCLRSVLQAIKRVIPCPSDQFEYSFQVCGKYGHGALHLHGIQT